MNGKRQTETAKESSEIDKKVGELLSKFEEQPRREYWIYFNIIFEKH